MRRRSSTPLVSRAQPLAAGQQDPLRAAHVAVPVGSAATGRRFEIFLEIGAPGAQLGRAIGGRQEVATSFLPFAGMHVFSGFQS